MSPQPIKCRDQTPARNTTNMNPCNSDTQRENQSIKQIIREIDDKVIFDYIPNVKEIFWTLIRST